MLEADPAVAKRAGPGIARKFIWEDMTAALLDRISSDWL
jgi:hypothetical protein